MKFKPYIIILFTLFVFASCLQKKQNSTLLHVESLVEEYPDSALHILQSIDNPHNFSKADYADYSLLMIQALDKSYQVYSDTLLRAASDYFLKGNDPVKKAKTYFYLGCFNKKTYYTKEAQDCFLKALDAAKNTNEYRLTGLIYNRLGNLYRVQQMYGEALEAHKKSYNYFIRVNQIRAEIAGLYEIGRDFSDMGKNDSALVYYKKALALVEKTDYTGVKSSILNDIAITYRDLNQLNQALEYVNQSILLEDVKTELAYNYLVKGRIFIKLQQYDSAHFYLDKVQEGNKIISTSSSYKELYKIEKTLNNYSKAIKYSDLYFSLEDSLNKIMQVSTLTTIEKRYQYDLIKTKNDELSSSLQKKEILLYQTLLGLIFLICASIWLYRRLKRIKDKVIQEKNLTLEQQEKLLEENNNYIAQEIKQLQLKDFQFRFKLFSETAAYKIIITNMGTKTPFDKKDEEQIINTIDKLFNKLASRLYENYKMSMTNICFCCLIKLFPEYTTEQLACLYNVTTRAIEQRKYRIKKTILGEDNTSDLISFLKDY